MRSDIMEQAQAIRKSMDVAANALTDEQAASAPMIYRAWSGNGGSGQENTGGGGGGACSSTKDGGYGGSGIVVIRKHKEAAA